MSTQDTTLSILGALSESSIEIPLASTGVSAGFPSPAEDYLDGMLDLNKHLIKHPASTFFARVDGESMKNASINDGDLLVIDKSIEPYDGCIAVCYIDGDFTLKRVDLTDGKIVLMPENEAYKPIEVKPDDEFAVWGVVRYVIKKV